MKLTIQRDRQTAAWLTLRKVDGCTLEIRHLETMPACRRQGFARQLVVRALEIATKERSDLVAILDPEPDYPLDAMKAWYRRLGFRPQWVNFGGYSKRAMLKPFSS